MYDKTTVINMFTLTLPALGNSLCYDIKIPFFRCVFFFFFILTLLHSVFVQAGYLDE